MTIGRADRWDNLGEWLAPRLGATGKVQAVDLGSPAAIGYSADTTIFSAAYESPDGPVEHRLVLRSEVPDPAVYPAQAPGIEVDIDVQRRVMQSVARTSPVPVAAILGYEPNPSVIGTPFFVMEFVEGAVPALDPPYPGNGFFAAAEPEERTRMITDGLHVLADVHRIDWRRAGVDWLLPAGERPTLARQLDIWERCGKAALGTRRHAVMDEASSILHRHLPECSEPVLCWGDPRPGNMIWRDWHCVSVTDWEAASIAPRESDVAWWLMFDRTVHEGSGLGRLPGDLPREEQLAIYEEASGRRLTELRLHEMFAAYRYCVIVVQVANRYVARGVIPEDNGMWSDNVAVNTLRQLMDS